MIRWAIYLGIFIASLLFLSSCNFNRDAVIGNGNVIVQEREVTEAFDRIEVNSATTLFVEQTNKPYVRVETDDNLAHHVSTSIRNNKLTIGVKGVSISSATKRTVYVGLPKLKEIETNSASSVVGKSTFLANELTINASSSSNIELDVEADQIEAVSSSAARIILSGKALVATMKSSSASTIDAQNLLVNDIKASSSSASKIHCQPLANFEAEASSASSIYYIGSPKNMQIQNHSAGSVNAKN